MESIYESQLRSVQNRSLNQSLQRSFQGIVQPGPQVDIGVQKPSSHELMMEAFDMGAIGAIGVLVVTWLLAKWARRSR